MLSFHSDDNTKQQDTEITGTCNLNGWQSYFVLVLYDELIVGKRPHGRHKLEYKDIYKTSMHDYSINYKVWEELVKD